MASAAAANDGGGGRSAALVRCSAAVGITKKGGRVCALRWASEWAGRTGPVNHRAAFRPREQQPIGQLGQYLPDAE
jgi:hypothetical protein